VLEQASEGELTDDGYLVYANPQGGLFAVQFDQRARRSAGSPVPLVADMPVGSAVGPFALSVNGLLVHLSGAEPMVRVLVGTPGGSFDTLPLPPQPMSYLRFSPDGSRLAITMGTARGSLRSTSFYEFSSKTLTRFGITGGPHAPVWSTDGTQLVFTATDSTADGEDLFVQPVDGSQPPRRLARRPGDQHGMAWVDDSTFVFSDGSPANATRGRAAISILDPRGSGETRDFLRGEYNGVFPAISPDGRWIAYGSDENGRTEVYLRPFPALSTGAQWKLSTDGGIQPRWSGDGRSIYFFSFYDGAALNRVEVGLGATVSVGRPQRVPTPGRITTAWDLDRRSGRIALAQTEGQDQLQLIGIPNWRKLLRAGSPTQ
jgi:eukaryotic-like serine/threonine-protein kinase